MPDLETWFQFTDSLCELLQKCDDKLDEYGEPDKSPLRRQIKQFITHAKKQKKESTT